MKGKVIHMAMTQASPTPAGKKAKTPLAVVTGSPAQVIPPHLVAKARRGAALQKILSDGKKELDALKDDFEALFISYGTREVTDSKGNVVAIRTHGEPNTLDQAALKAAHPVIVAKFTSPRPWDSVAFSKKGA